jgi:methyl-accepting chemotaxis protein
MTKHKVPTAPNLSFYVTVICALVAAGSPLGITAAFHGFEGLLQSGEAWAALIVGLTLGAVLLVTATVQYRRLVSGIQGACDVSRAIEIDDTKAQENKSLSGSFKPLAQSLKALAKRQSEMMQQIRHSVDQIETAATEVATGNADLSSRTEQAAASLQQTSSAVVNMASTVSANAQSAKQANQLARSSSEVAQRGGELMGTVEQTMRQITESSGQIAEIITVIDSIAFQTNILALNRAVVLRWWRAR